MVFLFGKIFNIFGKKNNNKVVEYKQIFKYNV